MKDLYFQSIEQRPQATDGRQADGILQRDVKRSPPQLGIRFNIVLFSQDRTLAQTVDPQMVFKTGQCFTLELEANRRGYLHIVAEGSSGEWTPLFPLERTQSGGGQQQLSSIESNELKPRTRVQAPNEDCVEFTDPPGLERVFVFVSEEPIAINELVKSFRLSDIARNTGSSVRGVRAQLDGPLSSRDVRLQKIDQPEAPDERPFTVYAVASPPRLFIEIRLEHK